MKFFTALLLQASFILLTLLTGVFGGASLLLMYRAIDKKIIILLQLATLFVFCWIQAPAIGALLFCMWLCIECYSRFIRLPFFSRTLYAVLISASTLMLVLVLGIYYLQDQNFWEFIRLSVQSQLTQIQSALKDVPLDVNKVIYQLPSAIFMIFGITLWVAVLFDSRSALSLIKNKIQKELKTYRAPDGLIWLLIASLLFSFVETPIKWLQEGALNVLNMTLLVYFFQGLSLLSFMLEKLKLNVILKMIVYFMFILQILLPICLGVLDFWLNFRAKISKKAE